MMPKRILAIGLLLCLGGLGAIWEFISGLMEDHLNLNFAVFLLPIGIGVLRGARSSRSWTNFFIIFGYVFCGIGLMITIAAPQNAYVNENAYLIWPDQQIKGTAAVPHVLLVLTLFGLFLIAIQKLLYSPKATAFFDRRSEQDKTPKASEV